MVQYKKPPERDFFFKGAVYSIEFALCLNGTRLAKEFLEGLPTCPELPGKLGQKAYTKLQVLFEQMANDGKVPNPSRFSGEDKVIKAFKYDLNNKLIRVACFQDGNSVVLTHGFFKRGAQKGRGEWLPEDLERANRIRFEHLGIFGRKR